MEHLKFFLSLLFLLTFSFVFAFAETGDLTVVSGKEFTIHYETKDSHVLSVEPNKDDFGLVFSIQANSPVATLELTLPRELIDSTEANGKDSDYIVLLDGTFASYINEGSTSTSRTILIQLAPDNKELEIIGTHLATRTSSANNPQTGQPATNTSEKPTEQKSNEIETAQQPGQSTSSTPQQPSQMNTGSITKTEQKQPLNEIISSIQLKSGNLSLNLDKEQLVEYSVIGAIVLIIIIVIASSARSKTRRQIRK